MACSAALAGIGYRSSQPLDTTWLDLEVTGTMVAAISGKEFHTDFTVMQPPVLRRLRLLTGEDFGTNVLTFSNYKINGAASRQKPGPTSKPTKKTPKKKDD